MNYGSLIHTLIHWNWLKSFKLWKKCSTCWSGPVTSDGRDFLDTWPNLVERDGISFDWSGIERLSTRLHLMNIQQLNESDGYQRERDVNWWYSRLKALAKWIGMNVLIHIFSSYRCHHLRALIAFKQFKWMGNLRRKVCNWQFARRSTCYQTCTMFVLDMHFTRDLSD